MKGVKIDENMTKRPELKTESRRYQNSVRYRKKEKGIEEVKEEIEGDEKKRVGLM